MEWTSLGRAIESVSHEAGINGAWERPELIVGVLQANAIMFAGERIGSALEKLADAIASRGFPIVEPKENGDERSKRA
jgi:hypothetical protein